MKDNLTLNIECTIKNINCKNKSQLLKIISILAANKIGVSSNRILKAIINREKMGSTGVGSGLAMPHGVLSMPKDIYPIGIFIKLNQSIMFNSIDNQPVDLIFSLIVPIKFCKYCLYNLSIIYKKLTNNNNLENLRKAKYKDEYIKIINKLQLLLYIL